MTRALRCVAALGVAGTLLGLGSESSADNLMLVGLAAGGGRLVVINSQTGAIDKAFDLGPVRKFWFGPSLVYDSASDAVLVPVVDSASANTRIVSLDLRTQSLREIAIVRDSIGYPWFDLIQRTRHLYMFGANGVELRTLDLQSRQVGPRLSATRTEQHVYAVMRARVAPDESRAYVSYHGGCTPSTRSDCTTGIDWISLTGTPKRCALPSAFPGYGCLNTHGGLAFLGNTLFAAVSNGIGEYDSAGTQVSWRGTPLNRFHLMEFSIASSTRTAFVTVSCMFGTGVSATPLGGDGGPNGLIRPDTCGDRAVLSNDESVVVVMNTKLGLELLDARTGRLIRSIAQSETLIDLAVVAR